MREMLVWGAAILVVPGLVLLWRTRPWKNPVDPMPRMVLAIAIFVVAQLLLVIAQNVS